MQTLMSVSLIYMTVMKMLRVEIMLAASAAVVMRVFLEMEKHASVGLSHINY